MTGRAVKKPCSFSAKGLSAKKTLPSKWVASIWFEFEPTFKQPFPKYLMVDEDLLSPHRHAGMKVRERERLPFLDHSRATTLRCIYMMGKATPRHLYPVRSPPPKKITAGCSKSGACDAVHRRT